MKKLFIEYVKGYNEAFRNIKQVMISKIDNKNHLIIKCMKGAFSTIIEETIIPLNEIRLCFLVNIDTMEEYFRYEK